MKEITLSYLLTFTCICMGTVYAQNKDYLFMVEQAVKAPSGHNTQPWLFKLSENGIEIHPNFEKTLPVVDADSRELFISLGCTAENLCIAASYMGYGTIVDIDNSGIITIGLKKDPDVQKDSLFDQITVRQTNRSVYNGKSIAEDTVAMLKSTPLKRGIKAYFYKNGTKDFDSILAYIVKGNIVQMSDDAFTDELKSWMRFNKKHQNRTNDGLSYAVFGSPNLPKFIVKPIISGMLNPKAQNKGDVKKMQSSSHFVLFTIQANTRKEWVELGMHLERFLLKSTGLGIVHAYLNQPNEVSSISMEMAEALNIPDEYPTILLRIGYGEKMPYSKRKGVEEVIIK